MAPVDVRFLGLQAPIVRMGAANFVLVAAGALGCAAYAASRTVGAGWAVAVVVAAVAAGVCVRYYVSFVCRIEVTDCALTCEHAWTRWTTAVAGIRVVTVRTRGAWAIGELICRAADGKLHVARWVMPVRVSGDLGRTADALRGALKEQGVIVK